MKTPEQIAGAIAARLKTNWAASVVWPEGGQWPQSWTVLPSGATNKAVAALTGPALAMVPRQWRAIAAAHPGVEVREQTWNVHGGQTLPQQVSVADVDTAAELAGDRDCPLGTWPRLLQIARRRLQTLRAINAALSDEQMVGLLRSTISYSDIDFELLCDTAAWFAANNSHAEGLTPRQVPLPGVHAKWLNTHQREVAILAGRGEGLGLLPNHAPRIHFSYLDPDHRASGHRIHDSHTLGDPLELPYQPRLIVISENKDTAILFPPLNAAIAIEGGGHEGASRLAQFDWIAACPDIIYWGDLDAVGFAIVSKYRATLPIRTILMDLPTYECYSRYGTNRYPDGRMIPAGGPALPDLTDAEASAYAAITAPAADPRRIEQERIPLDAALTAALQLAANPAPLAE